MTCKKNDVQEKEGERERDGEKDDPASTQYNGPKGENVKGIADLGLKKKDTKNIQTCMHANTSQRFFVFNGGGGGQCLGSLRFGYTERLRDRDKRGQQRYM